MGVEPCVPRRCGSQIHCNVQADIPTILWMHDLHSYGFSQLQSWWTTMLPLHSTVCFSPSNLLTASPDSKNLPTFERFTITWVLRVWATLLTQWQQQVRNQLSYKPQTHHETCTPTSQLLSRSSALFQSQAALQRSFSRLKRIRTPFRSAMIVWLDSHFSTFTTSPSTFKQPLTFTWHLRCHWHFCPNAPKMVIFDDQDQ